jgi:hypothetical protein
VIIKSPGGVKISAEAITVPDFAESNYENKEMAAVSMIISAKRLSFCR